MSIEQPTDPYIGITQAKTWDELYEALDEIKMIQGSKNLFTAEQIKGLIDEIREGKKPNTKDLTRVGGLRQKVEELLITQKSGIN